MTEFYKQYRPRSLEALSGQEGAKASINKLIEGGRVPHAVLLTGPSGVGKTTIARILKKHVDCGNADYTEINSADFKGIDTIRDIRRLVNLSPISGASRMWVIDEAHKLTGDAQNALLKILEDTPKHVYFVLATTDPQKIIKTIHTRCSEIKLTALSAMDIEKVLRRVLEKESLELGDAVIQEIVEAADGSARKALVVLEQVCLLESEEEQIKAVQATSLNKGAAIDLARALTNPRVSWGEIATILKTLENDDPEGIRYLILSYFRKVMLGGSGIAPRAFMIIDIFSSNFYDSKQAGLAAACWEVVHARR